MRLASPALPLLRAPAALVIAALALAACADAPVTGPGDRPAAMSVFAVAAPTTAGMSVEVTAADIPTPIVATLAAAAGGFGGQVRVPAGSDRTFRVRAFDAYGIQTHEGSTTVAVRPGANAALTIHLLPKSGDQPIVVSIGDYTVTVAPATVSLAAGETARLTATVTDPSGAAVASPAVAWGSLNPVVASVDAAGLVTGLVAGTTTIVASVQGSAASATVTVAGASTAKTRWVWDFEGTVGPEWSNVLRATTPTGARGFLGEYANGGPSVSLSSLAPHDFVIVELELFLMRSWDGNYTPWCPTCSPDGWSAKIAGGPTLLETTFRVYPAPAPEYQSFPETAPNGLHLHDTGAAERNTLGFRYADANTPDQEMNTVYRLSLIAPHAASSIRLDFAGQGLEVVTNESWGIDNVAVTLGSGAMPAATRVAIRPATPSVSVGATYALTSTVFHGTGSFLGAAGHIVKPLQWASSNPAVATVDAAGVVTGVSVGTARITASVDGQSDYSDVTVKP